MTTDPVAITYKVAIADANDPAQTWSFSLNNGVAVTKSDSTVYSPPLKRLWVGGAGNVAVRMLGGQSVTLLAVAAGGELNLTVDQVLSTGTSATNIIGFW
jgi:hypothetical protein